MDQNGTHASKFVVTCLRLMRFRDIHENLLVNEQINSKNYINCSDKTVSNERSTIDKSDAAVASLAVRATLTAH